MGDTRRVGRLVALVLTVLALASVLGCAAPDGVAVARWQLQSPSSTWITLPAHLEREVGHAPSFTLETDVALPADLTGRDLTLAFPDIQALATLRVNGVPVARLEDVLSERYRSRGPVAFRIPASLAGATALHLELTAQNTWTQSAWVDCVPRLSATPHGDRWYVLVRSWNDATGIAALGTLTPMGVAYLFMYLLDRRQVAAGWFALQALAASVYPLFQLGVSQVVFGKLEATILALSLSGATIGSVYFTYAHFHLGRPSRLWAGLFAGSVVWGMIFSGPFRATPFVGPLVVVTVALVVVQQVWVLGGLCLRRPRPVNALVFLGSWVGLGATAWDDCVSWLGVGEELGGLHAASGGLAIFGVLQSLALSREHITSLRRSDELNTQLQARVGELEMRQTEIDSLNEELRRQIAERSGQLADALARLGGTPGIPAPRLQPGERIKGCYQVVREIGSGPWGRSTR